MTGDRITIIWQRQFVGYMENPRKLPVVWRGRWISAQSPATADFLDALAIGRYLWVLATDDDGVETFATIEEMPGEEIELRLAIDEEDTAQIDLDFPLEPPEA
jgi:hypothetical protein